MDFLLDIGFTKPEIRVYEAILRLGESTIGAIAENAKVTPAKTYAILDRLARKGLITTILKGKTKHFQAYAPEAILQYVDNELRDLKEKRKNIEEELPKLARLEKKHINDAQVYEGYKGLGALYEEILDYLGAQGEDFIGFSLAEQYEHERANHFFQMYDRKRSEKDIATRLIAPRSIKSLLDSLNKHPHTLNIRYVDHAVPTGLIIWNDSVATLVFDPEPIAFVIRSPLVARHHREFFEYMWNSLQP